MKIMLFDLRGLCVTFGAVFIFVLFGLSQSAWAQETAAITDTKIISQVVPILDSDIVSNVVEVWAFVQPHYTAPQTRHTHELAFVAEPICIHSWYAPSNRKVQRCEQTLYETKSQMDTQQFDERAFIVNNTPDMSGIDIEFVKIVEDDGTYTFTDLPLGQYTVTVDPATVSLDEPLEGVVTITPTEPEQNSMDFAYLPDTYSIYFEQDSIYGIVEDYNFIYLGEVDTLTMDALAIRFRFFTITDTLLSWDVLTNTVSTDEVNVPLAVSTHFTQATPANGVRIMSVSVVLMLGLCVWYLKVYQCGRGR